MNEAAVIEKPSLSLEFLFSEIEKLRERVEDLEDLRYLEEAIKRNAGKPLMPWEDVKAGLGLD